MVKGRLIQWDDIAPIAEREFARLDDYQAAGDGYFEPVDVVSQGCTIYVNEEGLLRRLPLNPRATFIWWFYTRAGRQRAMLVGDAVAVGVPDRAGDSTDIPEEVRALLMHARSFAIEVKVIGDDGWYIATSSRSMSSRKP
ncbi:DUF3846 domain-containing protein [Agromyces sp. NPDC056523]|uniref:DUF3846 domain-containing protein n=1 Tax=Agromyces sp. NPDC056523 TaxID=3345850 RepID=UPI003671B142